MSHTDFWAIENERALQLIGEIAPAGHYVAVRVGFAYPTREINGMPEEWSDTYTRQGLMLWDPSIKWAYENSGHVRWSALDVPDPMNILSLAACHGLTFGVTVAYHDPGASGHRTIGMFSHRIREFSKSEISELEHAVRVLHGESTARRPLTSAEVEVLTLIKNGFLMKQAAAEIGVSESAIKARLKNAKFKLGAKTNTQATAVAQQLGLI